MKKIRNWNKLSQFLSTLKCSIEKKECLEIVAHKDINGFLANRDIESFMVNDNCTELTIYYTPSQFEGDFDWIKI